MADFTDKVAKARAAGYSDDEIVQFLSSGEMSAKIKKAQDAGYSSGEIVGFLGNGPQAPSGPRDAATALTDPEWAKKGRTLYKESNAQDFQGSDEEAAKWLNNYLYDFNYRLAGVGADNARGTLDTAAQISGYSDEGKKAFVEAQTQFENMNTTLGGVGEAAKRVFTDPTTYIGLGTFGVGTGVAQGAKQVAKKGVVELAKIGAKRAATRGAAIGAAEGATYGAVSDLGQQQAMVNAGGQEAIDPVQTAQVAGLSGLTGGVLGGAVGGASGFIRGRNPTVKAAQQIVADPEVAVRGAEITQRMANLQDSVQKLSPETHVGKEQVNANLAPIKGDVKNAIDQLGLEKNTARKLKEGLDKASGISEEDIANLRTMPGGDAVAENILFLRQANAMTRPIPNDGIVPKLGRFALDKLSPVPMITDPLKSAVFPSRISGELRVDRMVSPRNRKIAEEILRLQGSSAATRGRQELLDAGLNMARARRAARDTQKAEQAAARAEKTAKFEQQRADRLENAKKVAEERKIAAEQKAAEKAKAKADKAERDAEKARQVELAARIKTNTALGRQYNSEMSRQQREADATLRNNIRTNTGLGRQFNAEEAKAAREAAQELQQRIKTNTALGKQQSREAEAAFKQNVRTNTGLGKQQAREAAQALSQNVRTNTGLGRQQNQEIARQAREQTASFENALNNVNAKMRMQQRLDNQRLSEIAQAEAALAKVQADQSAAKNAEKVAYEKALRKTNSNMKAMDALRKFRERTIAKDAKPIRSRKFTTKPSEAAPTGQTRQKVSQQMSEEELRQYASEGGDIRNQQRWEQGKATIQEYEQKALEVAKDQPKDIRRALERAIADMRLAKKDQDARYKAYFDAIDAVAPYGADALEVVDDALYFLVKKYQ